jgi:hypothetical protein
LLRLLREALSVASSPPATRAVSFAPRAEATDSATKATKEVNFSLQVHFFKVKK